MASPEGRDKTLLNEVPNSRDHLQFSSHWAPDLVASHFTACLQEKGSMEARIDNIEFVIRNLPPAQMFSYAAVGGTAIASHPRGSHRSWLG